MADEHAGRRFAALDGWRGLAAVMVVLLHVPLAGPIGGSAFVRNAYLFVDLFFVLSGFVIAHAYADRLRRGGSLGGFMRARLARVCPLHLVMLGLFVAFELAMLAVRGPDGAFQGGNSPGALVANLAMLHAFGVVDSLGWNYPSWSISAELLAYLLFGALVVALPRLAVPVLVVVVLVGALVLLGVVGHLDVTIDWGWLRCLVGFSLGALLRLLVWPRMRPADPGASLAWTIAEGATALAVVAFVVLAGTTALSLAAPLVFAYVILAFAHEGRAFSRVLKSAPIAFLGLVSYSIYMTHAFVISRGINAATVFEALTGVAVMVDRPDGTAVLGGGVAHEIAALIVILVAVVAFSALTYRLVERPGLRMLTRRGRTRRGELQLVRDVA